MSFWSPIRPAADRRSVVAPRRESGTRTARQAALLLTALAGLLAAPAASSAKALDPDTDIPDRTEPAPLSLKAKTDGVTITPKLGAAVPLELSFTNTAGQTVRLKDYFNTGKPVVLQLGYYGCPMLCDIVSQNAANALKTLDLDLGKDYSVLYVSIDPKETYRLAAKKKQSFVSTYDRPGATEAWNLLVGNEINTKALADSVGFSYKWVQADQVYSHPAALIILTPDGRVSRYLNGVDYPTKTLRLSLVEASDGKVGGLGDQLLLTCFHYNETTGEYTFAAMALMQVTGAVTVLVIGAVLARRWYRDARLKRGEPTPQAA